ncbi:MAG: secretin N-terminal domain-containing protein [Simkaniaceae bacterium]
MKYVYQNIRKFFILSPSIASIALAPLLSGADKPKKLAKAHHLADSKAETNEGYTINFNNVGILEFLRFISRIADINFIYDSSEMNFPITLTSQEPTSLDDLMAALVQILRIQGFELIDQGNNLIIHRNPAVQQIGTVIADEVPFHDKEPLPIVTRVFRIHNTTPGKLVSLIQPMMSSSALIEAFQETRQLIVTDNSANVNKIAELLLSLDAPHLPLDIDAFVPKENSPESLIEIAQKIMQPLAEGNPIVMVPQSETKTIFIISTPYLIERTIAVLEDLDNPTLFKELKNENVLLYKLKYKPAEMIEGTLEKISKAFEEQGYGSEGLTDAINSMRYVKESHSLLFTGTPTALSKVEGLLEIIDVSGRGPLASHNSQFFIYQAKNRSAKELAKSLNEVGQNLEEANLADPGLLFALKNMRIVKKSNSLIFTGDQSSLDEIKQMLPALDTLNADEQKTYSVYKLQNVSGEIILKDLRKIAKNMKASGIEDKELLSAINNVEWIKATNSLYISGSKEAIDEVKGLVEEFDVIRPQDANNFYIYKPRYKTAKEIKGQLVDIAESLEDANLTDPTLLMSINSMRYERSSDSLIFTGTENSIAKIKQLLPEIDSPDASSIKSLGQSTFLIYQPKSVPASQLLNSLKAVTDHLKNANTPDKELIQTIQSVRYVKETNALIFTGPEEVLTRVETILAKFDIPSLAPIQKIGQTTFFVYQPKYIPVGELTSSLKAVAMDLSKSSDADQSLISTIDNMRFKEESRSIVFTGPEPTLEKVQQLIEKFDNPQFAGEMGGPHVYQLFTPKYQHGEELIDTMKDFEKNLVTSGVQQSELFEVINNLKWIEKTCSILVSGTEGAVKEVEQLLTRFDIATPGSSEIETLDDVSFLIYKLQYHRGDAIEAALKLVANDLKINQQQKESPTSEKATGLVQAINSVQWIEPTNSLIGTGDPHTLTKLKELLKSLDTPLRQVFIEVLVLETEVTNNLDLGLRWGSQGKYRNRLGWGTGSYPNFASGTDPALDFNTAFQSTDATNTPTGTLFPIVSGFDLGVIGDIIFHKGQSYAALGSFLSAAKIDGDITIVLNQKIITQDGKNSTLFVGDNLPFTGSTVQNQTENTLTTANIEYIDVGVSLSITPTLGDDDIITLDIDQQITEVTNNPSNSSTSNLTINATGIATSKTNTTTSVAVPDRHFLVLSGMMRNTNTHSIQSIPCLGGIPLLGLAFQDKSTATEKKNVIIFIKPHIIHSFREYEKITAHEEDKGRSFAIPEDYDAGLDLMQTPEDD